MTGLRHVEHCMGTVFSIDIRGAALAPDALDSAIALLHDIDRRFSTYRADSVISRLARGESGAELLDAEVSQVLADCDRWTRSTDGWFDARAGRRLDPSGYVKGWAIQRVSELLVLAGSTSHCVNGGGDIQCVGSAGGRPWQLGVLDPRDSSRVLATVTGDGIALATSGTAERGEHILDPRTGRPAGAGLLSLSVAGRSVIDCDVYATAGFAMGPAARDWFADRQLQAFAVCADGRTWSTFG